MAWGCTGEDEAKDRLPATENKTPNSEWVTSLIDSGVTMRHHPGRIFKKATESTVLKARREVGLKIRVGVFLIK